MAMTQATLDETRRLIDKIQAGSDYLPSLALSENAAILLRDREYIIERVTKLFRNKGHVDGPIDISDGGLRVELASMSSHLHDLRRACGISETICDEEGDET